MRLHQRPLVAALLASSALVAPAYAQTADAPQEQVPMDQNVAEVGEIVVTGIRASQAQSIDIKRNETALVDAISAEDIGKLPDVTVADALSAFRAFRCSARRAKARPSTSAVCPRSSPC
ncbi:hypothetical protein MU852_15070 [Brevundimonas albigilva]|uniref:hypothetical protein n=1 Tax=Brevundimonas albigilva TaxID=1312364 RepID=UPI00201B6DDE|nr:hypothetical protein [Brevundimonas albigilva]UQV18066.1 hypothetical protein MU852_15070 [Brevundimonas albigilva]